MNPYFAKGGTQSTYQMMTRRKCYFNFNGSSNTLYILEKGNTVNSIMFTIIHDVILETEETSGWSFSR